MVNGVSKRTNPQSHVERLKMKILFIIWLMALVACSFGFGMSYQYSKQLEEYEARIEWLSKELEGTRHMMFDELYHAKMNYLKYQREGEVRYGRIN